MKRIISLVLFLLIATMAFAGCTDGNNTKKGDKLHIVATIFPVYDWARQIAGDKAEITFLLEKGVDLHSYQPTANDIIDISTCDMFIYVGGESDKWVDDALSGAVNKNMVVVNLLEVLGDSAKEEEIVEGMEAEEEDDEDEDEAEYDEHVWLSLRNAELYCRYISGKLIELDAENEDFYKANTESYINKLNDLDAEYKSVTDNASVKTLLFGDRFPFRYLVDDYGLSYYAAFAGCSAETEASFNTIIFLAEKVDELDLRNIMKIESSDGSIARTIKDATKTKNQVILSLDSMQSTTGLDAENGVTYLSIMQKNLETLKSALGV